MKKIFFLVITILIFRNSFSQNITISGFVTDAINNEKLIGATIFDNNSKNGCITNNYGHYSLNIKKSDTLHLIVSFIGYNIIDTNLIDINSNTEINFQLQQSENQLNEVAVYSNSLNLNLSEISKISFSAKDLTNVPSLAGERDIMKILQLMPGISQGSEGRSGLVVRGGSADQNLILLDDVPLYYTDHLGGFVSIFNDDAINKVEIYKGIFPAKYGNRLSSVVDISMKEGNMKKIEVNGNIGLISSKLSIEGPIKKDKISFLVSARRMMLDLWAYPIVIATLNNSIMKYYFYDVNAKINYKLSEKQHIYLSFYKGNDKMNSGSNSYFSKKLSTERENITNWGSTLLAFRWNYVINPKLFSNVTLSYTDYLNNSQNYNYYKVEYLESISTNYFKSGIEDFSAKVDFEYNMMKNNKLDIGCFISYQQYAPVEIKYFEQQDNVKIIDTIVTSKMFFSNISGIYFNDELDITRFLNLNIGCRFDYQKLSKYKFFPEPRIVANFVINPKITVNIGYALNKQNIHQLSFSGMGLFSDIWVPSTDLISDEKSQQIALSLVKISKDNKYKFQVESYYKKLSGLVDFGYGSFWENIAKWEEKTEKDGIGQTYGIEFLLQKNIGKISGWLSYSLSKSTRQFENINSGRVYDYDYDRPHEIKIFLNYKIKDNLYFSCNWFFQSGRPISIPIGRIATVDPLEFNNTDYNYPYRPFEWSTDVYTEKNSIRMKPYHRLDIGLNLIKEKKHGTRTWSFSVYNVYNRQNAYYYFFDYKIQEDGEIVRNLYLQSLFPIIPSVSYSFKF